MSTTISSFLPEIKKRLKPCSPDLFCRETETIFQQVLNLTRNDLYLKPHTLVSDKVKAKIEDIVTKRLSGLPLQYAMGKVFFYSEDYIVDENVLIPRPDTETLINTILQNESSNQEFFVDIGTGSGIIAQSILSERENYSAIAIDISHKALQTASKNICSHGLLLCCDKLNALKAENQFDFIVSNPPYITSKEMTELEDSVLNHEPHKALWGGEDGLDFYRYFANNLDKYLKKDGNVYFEIGYLQGESVSKILLQNNWHSIEVIKDLGNRDRVIKAGKRQ